MENPYKILGISEDATDIEVKNAYRQLARKYHPDNYANDEAMAELANEKMKEINEAYDEIMRMRSTKSSGQSSTGNGGGSNSSELAWIRSKIKNGRFADAERELDSFPESDRTAEWHYLKSILLNRRGWINDAARELEIACNMDPLNMEYQQAKQMFNAQASGYGRNYGNGYDRRGNSSTCDLCMGLLCADTCCECMGGDCISCC